MIEVSKRARKRPKQILYDHCVRLGVARGMADTYLRYKETSLQVEICGSMKLIIDYLMSTINP